MHIEPEWTDGMGSLPAPGELPAAESRRFALLMGAHLPPKWASRFAPLMGAHVPPKWANWFALHIGTNLPPEWADWFAHGKRRGRASVAGALLGLFALTALSFSAAEAQEEESSPRWSVGTSLTFPMVRIYQLHLSYAVGDRQELLFGPCFQNYRHTSFTARAYTLLLGYRYYVWRGLHLEAELYPAYNNLRSHVTGSNYPGVELWSEIKIGYRFNLNDRWYIQPAPGIGFGIFQSNPPPGFWDEIETPIFVPQLILGFRL